MAKKKKLNKRAVILLSVAGVAVLAGGLGIVLSRLPKDPEAAMRKGDDEYKNKNFIRADQYYREAVVQANKANAPRALYYQKLVQLHLEWLKSPILNQTEQVEHYTIAKDSAKMALRIAPADIETHHLLCDMMWQYEILRSANPPAATWSGFIAAADELLRHDPNDATMYFRRGYAKNEMFSRKGGDEYRLAAVEDLKKSLELKGDQPDTWQTLAMLYAQMNEFAQAEKTFADAIAALPPSAQVHVTFANFLIRQSKPDEALKQLEEACRIEPTSPIGQMALARYYISQSKLEPAQKALEEAIRIAPQESGGYASLADLYMQQGKLDESVIVLRDGLKMLSGPSSAPATDEATAGQRLDIGRARLSDALATKLLLLAERNPQERQQYIDQARQCLDAMMALGGGMTIPVAKINGRIAFLEKRYDDVINELKPLYDPANLDRGVAWLLVDAYQNKMTPGPAEQIIRDMLKLPDGTREPLLHHRLAVLMMYRNDMGQASKELAQALAIDPTFAPSLELMKRLRSIETAQVPANISTPDALLMLQVARQKITVNQIEDGMRIVRNVLAQRPDDAEVVLMGARVLGMAQQDDEAIALLQKAAEKNPADNRIQSLLALAKEKDPAKQKELRLAEADKTEDPLTKALQKAQICLQSSDIAGYEKYVNEAAGVDPQNPVVIEAQLRLIMSRTKDNSDWESQARQTVAKLKDSALAKYFSGEIAYTKGDFKQAISDFTAALKDREEKSIRCRLGDAHAAMNDFAKAQEVYRAVLMLDPGFPSALVSMAKITARTSPGPEHEQYVEQAYQVLPTDPYVRKEYLRIQQDQMSPDKAIKARNDLLKQYPDDLDNMMQLAMLYERSKQLNKAEELYNQVCEKSPDKLGALRQLLRFYTKMDPPKHAEIARLQNMVVDKTLFPDTVAAMILYADSCVWQGTSFLREKARNAYARAIEMNEKDPRGYRAMAAFESDQGNALEALRHMRSYCDLIQASNDRTQTDKIIARKEMARAMIEAGQFDEALGVLKGVLAEDPADAQALGDEAVVLMRQDKMDEAEKLLNQAVENNRMHVEPLILRASLYVSKTDIAKAEADLEAARKMSSHPEILRRIASLFVRMGKVDKAEQVYNDILTGNSDNPQVMYELALLYLNRPTPDYTHLDALLEQAQKKATQKVMFYKLEAEGRKRRGQTTEQIRALEKAYELSPDRASTEALVSVLIDANQADRAAQVLQAAPEKEAIWVKALSARLMAKQKRVAEAEDAFKSAVENCQGGDLLFVLEQMERAYGAKEGIAKLDAWKVNRSEDWLFNLRLADWYGMSNLSDAVARSKALLEKALTLAKQPEQKAEIEAKLGIMHYRMNDMSSAEKYYLSSLKEMPDNAQCLNNLAYLYANDLKRPGDALAYAKKAARLAPSSSDVLDTYGLTLLKLDQTGEALRVLQQAIEADNPSPVCRFHLGQAYEKQNSFEYARNSYKGCLEMLADKKDDPLYKQCQESLDRIRSK